MKQMERIEESIIKTVSQNFLEDYEYEIVFVGENKLILHDLQENTNDEMNYVSFLEYALFILDGKYKGEMWRYPLKDLERQIIEIKLAIEILKKNGF